MHPRSIEGETLRVQIGRERKDWFLLSYTRVATAKNCTSIHQTTNTCWSTFPFLLGTDNVRRQHGGSNDNIQQGTSCQQSPAIRKRQSSASRNIVFGDYAGVVCLSAIYEDRPDRQRALEDRKCQTSTAPYHQHHQRLQTRHC